MACPVQSSQRYAEHCISPTPQIAPPRCQPPLQWRYDMRKEAQEIVPGLYLGAINAALNADKLVAAGITHLLCVRDMREKGMVFPRFPNQFQYYTFEIKDSDNEKIIGRIPPCLKFIDDALSSGGKVLAHCITGIALSPAIVVSYLMTKYVWSFESALTYVQTRRYCISPMNFKNQLKEYEPIYRAMQMIQQSGSGTGAGMTNGDTRAKRILEEEDDNQNASGRRVSQRSETSPQDEDDGDVRIT